MKIPTIVKLRPIDLIQQGSASHLTIQVIFSFRNALPAGPIKVTKARNMKEQKYRNTKTDTLEIYVGILNLIQRQDGLLHVCGEAEGAGGGGDEEAGQVLS